MITLHRVGDVVGGAVAGSSVVFRLMPPPEKFAAYPKLQKWYALAYLIVQWIALNK